MLIRRESARMGKMSPIPMAAMVLYNWAHVLQISWVASSAGWKSAVAAAGAMAMAQLRVGARSNPTKCSAAHSVSKVHPLASSSWCHRRPFYSERSSKGHLIYCLELDPTKVHRWDLLTLNRRRSYAGGGQKFNSPWKQALASFFIFVYFSSIEHIAMASYRLVLLFIYKILRP